MAGIKTAPLADFFSGAFTGTMGENGQMINQSIPDYMKASQDFQANAAGKIDPMGGTPYTFGAALPYFDKNTMNTQDWLGGTDPQSLLDSMFSNSGAIGPWAPKYNPQTGEVSYFADNSTSEWARTIATFAAMIAGGAGMGAAAGAGAGAAEGAGAGGSIFAADASPGAFGWGGGEALGGTGGLAGGAGGAFDMTGSAAIPGQAGLEGGFGQGSIFSGASTPGSGGIQQLFQQLQQIPGGSTIVSKLVQSLMGGQGEPLAGGGAMTGSASGDFNLGSLLPLLGVGSGLNTMFNSKPAVDPAMVQALWQAGQQTYNTALDPQRALYARTQQQLQDQTRASEAARGITMGPYGAGVENKAMGDFNIDWQNAQLQRQLQGLQGFTGAGNVGANAGVAGAAQTFAQNQTGLNNLTTGLGGLFGQGGTGSTGGIGGAMNPIGSWLNSLFTGSGNSSAGNLASSFPGFTPTGGGLPVDYNTFPTDSTFGAESFA